MSINKKMRLVIYLFLLVFLSTAVSTAAQKRAANAQAAGIWKWQFLAKADAYIHAVSDDLAVLNYSVKDQNFIVAIDVGTGKAKWETKTSQVSQVLIDANSVYVRTDTNLLRAFDSQTGRVKWSFEPKEYLDSSIIELKLKDQILYALGKEIGLMAFDAQTGQRKWNFRPCFDYERYYGSSSRNKIVIAGSAIVVPCANGNVYQVNAETGKSSWKKSYPKISIEDILADDNNLYILGELYEGGAFVQAIDTKAGKQIWIRTFEISNLYDSEMHLNGDKLYLQSKFGNFTAIDLQNGETFWETEEGVNAVEGTTPEGYQMLVSTETRSLVFDNDSIYGTSEEGQLRAVAASSGEVKWQVKLSDSYLHEPKLIGKTILTSDEKFFYAINSIDGKLLWKIQAPLSGGVETDKHNNLYLVAFKRLFGATDLARLEKLAKRGTNGRVGSVAKLPNPFPFKKDRNFDLIKPFDITAAGGPGGIFISDITPASGKAFFTVTEEAKKQGTLYEINLVSGLKKPIAQLTATRLTAPTIIDGIAFVGSSQSTYDGAIFTRKYLIDAQTPAKLYAIDLSSNKILWSFDTLGAMTSPPVTDGKRIYFASADGSFYAIDKDGKLVWRNFDGLPEFITYKTEAAKLFAENDKLYLTTPTNKTLAVDAASGDIIWSAQAKQELSNPIADAECLYVGEGITLNCFDKQSGILKRQTEVSSNIDKLARLQDFIVAESYYSFTLIDKNGKVLWDRQIKPDDVLVVESEFWYVRDNVAINAATGERVRRLGNLKDSEYDKPFALNRDTIYFNVARTISALNVKTGKVLWKTVY